MIVLAILGYTLLSLFLIVLTLVLMLLFVPFRYNSWGIASEETIGMTACFGWLFGAVRVQYSVNRYEGQKIELSILKFFKKNLSKEPPFRNRKEKAEKEEGKEKKKKSKNPFTREKFKVLLRSAKNVIRAYKPRYFKLEATVGFEDAYHTGLLCAGFETLYPVLKHVGHIRLNPVFDDEIFEGTYELDGQMMMGILAYEGLKVFFSKPFRKKLK